MLQKRFKTSWTAWTRRSSSSGRCIEIYDRHVEKLREELTLARIDRHSGQLDELDVEGTFRSQNASYRAPPTCGCSRRSRSEQLFLPEGMSFDGNGFVGTAVTAPAFSYLQPIGDENERMVDLTGIEPVTS